jgi:flagellar biosynthesis protein FlhB
MAETDSGQDKSEPASAKRRDDARKKGSVARSMEVNSSAVLLAGIIMLMTTGGAMGRQVAAIARRYFTEAGSFEFTSTNVTSLLAETIGQTILIAAPVLAMIMVIGTAAGIAQAGFMFSVEALQPKWGKMNPLSGIKRIFFSRRSIVEILKGIVKIAVVGYVAWWTLKGLMDEAPAYVEQDIASILDIMVTRSLSVGLRMSAAFVGLAAVDYAFQRFEFERELRMTKQEVKEESKMFEGDPVVKGRIRTVQRQIAYRRMMHDVPKADVVVTNPTHFAIALKYDNLKMRAPRVVAKGADLMAQRIKEVARQHEVPIVEDKPLAQMLYKTVEVGQEIPAKLFQAVAQILAYIYRMKRLRSA